MYGTPCSDTVGLLTTCPCSTTTTTGDDDGDGDDDDDGGDVQHAPVQQPLLQVARF